MFVPRKKNKSSRLGKLVVERGWVSTSQLDTALAHQKHHNCRLGESLIALELIETYQLKVLLRKQKLLRSLVAGCVMATAPICPVLADESDDKNSPKTELKSSKNSKSSQFDLKAALHDKKLTLVQQGDASLLQQTSVRPLMNSRSSKLPLATSLTPLYIPQTIKSKNNRLGKGVLTRMNLKKKLRSDRYKDTQPAIYRLTVKGFSLLEKCEDKLSFAEFNRVKDYPYKRYELMFSIRKEF